MAASSSLRGLGGFESCPVRSTSKRPANAGLWFPQRMGSDQKAPGGQVLVKLPLVALGAHNSLELGLVSRDARRAHGASGSSRGSS
jgi:hypothetical protein